jgi:hemerythrin
MHYPSHPAAGTNLDALREEMFVRAECFLEAYDAGRRAHLVPHATRLMAAARAQFAAEEAVLVATGSLSLVRHQLEHEKFLADLELIAQQARSGDAAALEALRPACWLTAWLAAHGRTDRELEPRILAVA